MAAANIIAEIGINHKGDVEKAKNLILQAKETNCWGVKFQYRNIETFYNSSLEIGDGILLEEMKRTDLSIKEFTDLAEFSKSLGIKIGLSFFRLEDFHTLGDKVDCFDFYKVPSAECTNLELIEALVNSKKQVMISTGGHELSKIEEALLKFNSNSLVVFHCVANYPAKLGSQNLLFINKLCELGFKQVGYSSHDEDIEICLMAMSLGATWIERHITDDCSGTGLDDSSSSEVADFYILERFASEINGVLGSKERVPNQGEILNMQNLGTGIYAKKDLISGSRHSLSDFHIKAPRIGLSVGDYLIDYKKKKLNFNLRKGEALTGRHFKTDKVFDKKKLSCFAKEHMVGIPVRLHDFHKYKSLIDAGVYEFHLSYQEVLSKDLMASVDEIEKDDLVSIHLPDYLEGNRIIDPISDSKSDKEDSRKLISSATAFASAISQKTGKSIPLVGSFSQRNGRGRKEILDDLFEYIDSNSSDDFQFLPQWLPVYAWYFGGSVKLDLFNSQEDIDYLVDNKREICLDLCHLSLSSNYFGKNWLDWYGELRPLTGHFHLADAMGFDGEGLEIGKGEIEDFSIFFESNKYKIIEVWQGHHNEGVGFMNALETLYKQVKL